MKKKYMFRIFYMFILFFLPVWGSSVTGSDKKDETSQLQHKIYLLEERIQLLEETLKKCTRLEPEEFNSTGWQNKKNWRRLETGMDMEKVQAILGKPVKTIMGVRTLWYYPSNYCGYVSFDKDGNLIGWNEP